MGNHVIVPYSELVGKKPTECELVEILRSFQRDSTFCFLMMINNFLSIFPPNHEPEKYVKIQRFLSANLLDEETWNLTNEKLIEVTPLQRPIFSRWQMLYLMKRVLLESPVDGSIDPSIQGNTEARYLLGKACLIANDLYVSEQQEEKSSSTDPTSEDERTRVLIELLTQILPTSELFNSPETRDASVRTFRYLRIFRNSFSTVFEGVNLSDYFKSRTGISLETFLEMVLAIEVWFLNQNVEGLIENPANFNLNRETYFSTLNYSEDEVSAFFELTLTPIEQLISEVQSSQSSVLSPQYDFRAFRKSPLVPLSGKIVTTIDTGLFTEKYLLGLYHTILNAFPEDDKLRRLFFKTWGKVFEIYVNEILSEIYPLLSNRFYPNTFFVGKEEREAFDGIVEFPTALAVMEYKGGLLNSTAKYSGDSSLLLEDLDRKFGRKSNDSGIRQLARKIEQLYNADETKRSKLRDVQFVEKELIYPVLVFNDLSLEFGLAVWLLRAWFEEEIKTRNIDPQVRIKSLLPLSIDDIETIAVYLIAGDFTFEEFLQFYCDALTSPWFEPMITVHEVVTRFRKERNITFRPRDKFDEEFSRIIENVVERFKVNATDSSGDEFRHSTVIK